MLQLPNYTLEKRVQAGSTADIYAGVRDSDGAPVVVISYAGDDAAEPGSRARREFDALRAVQGPGVPRAIELITEVRPPILVVERVSGVALSSWVRHAPLAPDAFIVVALQLAEILERVHTTALLHCSVTPSSVCIDSDTLKTNLVGFGAARVLGAVDRTRDTLNGADVATLAYIAPEQTGRMARGIDPRSDLYALGATFYFALTGKPPFESDDPLALVHAHMARMPVPPLEHRPELPATLSRIVVKLLQKEPADRYQTARALARDLAECRSQLERTGRIPDEFPLGTADAPVRPLFSARLYGRGSEIRALHAAYERITSDAVEFVLLCGAPGVGKSALVHELRTPLARTGGYLAQGKFDLYRRDVPYSGLVAALHSLVHQILSESAARVARWRTELTEALGKLAAVVVELVPDLGIILTDAPPVPRLGPRETQSRLAYALKRLVLGLGRPDHPLVLFLDDLQWADPGSRSVLEALLDQSRGASLLVVATCRDEHEPALRPVAALTRELASRGVRVTQIPITPLGVDATCEMLEDALDHPIERIRGLAETVSAKTGSNPLWIQQFIGHVHELGLIRYDHPGGWTWDESAIANAAIPEGAVGLMVAKLERLAVRPRALIQFASCVGDEFEVELLSELTGDPRDALEPALFELAKEGLIAPSPHGFRFVHDRIREAAQALMSEDERSRLHHRTGRHLIEHVPLAVFTDRVFEIADHLNHALALLSEDDRCKALEINVAAGARALSAGASQTASAYLSIGRRLLRDQDWESSADLAFNLSIQSAEAAYQTQDFELALQLLDGLDARPLERVQQAQVAAKRIACTIVARPSEAFALTLAELRRFGVNLPTKTSIMRVWLALEYTNWLFRGPLDASAFGRKPSNDPAWAAPILVLGAGGATLVRSGKFLLLCLGTTQSLCRFRLNGAVPGMSFSIAAFVAERLAIRRDIAGAERYVQAALDWMERMPSPIDCRTHFSLCCFTLPFLKPRRSLLEQLRRLTETAREVGDPEYAVYIAAHRWSTLALCGEPLSMVLEEIEELQHATHVEEVRRTFAAYAAVYETLLHSNAGSDSSRIQSMVSDGLKVQASGDASVALHSFMVLCYRGKFEAAAGLLPSFKLEMFSTNPSSALDFMMFRSMCLAANAAGKGRFARLRLACELRLSLFFHRGRIGPDSDFGHVALVVQAESARLLDRTAQALALYQQATKVASERGYRHHAALIQERRSALLYRVRRDLEAQTGLRQAMELYKQWGARAKVSDLAQLLRE